MTALPTPPGDADRPRAAGRRVTVRAAAKVNLHLGVGAPRPDGFHPLVTVYQAVGLYDDVTVSPAEAWSVTVSGSVDLASVPRGADAVAGNLAVRAGRALAAHHGLRDRAAAIHLDKGIPVAGGMAGGSADAAAALVALDRLWSLGTPDADLLGLAARLGSDVPFSLLGGTALGTGRGELVEPVEDAGSWWWVAVPSGQGLATPSVYRRFDDLVPGAPAAPAHPAALLRALSAGDPVALAAALRNDLQAPALDLRPDLAATFEAGLDAGALAALLSGSGPTVLLLAEDAAHARRVAAGLLDRGVGAVLVMPAPVAGAHVLPDGEPGE